MNEHNQPHVVIGQTRFWFTPEDEYINNVQKDQRMYKKLHTPMAIIMLSPVINWYEIMSTFL